MIIRLQPGNAVFDFASNPGKGLNVIWAGKSDILLWALLSCPVGVEDVSLSGGFALN